MTTRSWVSSSPAAVRPGGSPPFSRPASRERATAISTSETSFFPSLTSISTSSAVDRALEEETTRREEISRVSTYLFDEAEVERVLQSSRLTGSSEMMAYWASLMRSREAKEPCDPVMEYLNRFFTHDRRFSRAKNEQIQSELYKQTHDLRIRLFHKLEREEQRLNETGIFDEQANRIRIRSKLKVEMQKIMLGMLAMYKKMVRETEIELGLPPLEISKNAPLAVVEGGAHPSHRRNLNRSASLLSEVKASLEPRRPAAGVALRRTISESFDAFVRLRTPRPASRSKAFAAIEQDFRERCFSSPQEISMSDL